METAKLSWVENKGVLIEIDGEIPHKFIVFKRDIEEKKDWWGSNKACEDIFCRIPTSRELSIIYENKDEINQLMTEHGCEPLKEDWYWSSSEYSSSYAWGQYFGSGYIFHGTKGNGNYVRPVLTL